MKLRNNSSEFTLQFNAEEHTIPKGDFEVNEDKLGHHIIFTAIKIGKDVAIVEDSKPAPIKKAIEPVVKPIAEKPVVEKLVKK